MVDESVRAPARRFRLYFDPVDGARTDRSSIGSPVQLVVHLLSLVAVGVVFAYLARGQWFFYDEWDLLSNQSEWDLLAPHNGHLSLGLALLFTAIKSVVGLMAYWPYLAFTVATHLAIVHLLWRVMNRAGVQPLIALLLPLVFALLAAGAENTLWAFQTGFIAPIGFGLAAFLVADRPRLGVGRLIAVGVLLILGLLFASTALPFVAAVLAFIAVRHRFLPALLIGVAIGAPYLLWRILFANVPSSTDGFAARGIGDYLVAVPDYLVRGLVDGLAAVGPFEALSGSVLVVFVVWLFLRGRRTPFRETPVWAFLLVALLIFAVLTAVSRVGLGPESASAGRYVYFYVATALPAFGVALTSLASRRLPILAAAAGVSILIGYNAVGLVVAARGQAGLEQLTHESLSAALVIADGTDVSDDAHPLPVLAPTLSMGEIREFADAGQLPVTPFGDVASLSTRVNLELVASRLITREPFPDCEPDASGGHELPAGIFHQLKLDGDESAWVDVTVTENGVASAYTRIRLEPGTQQLIGFEDADIRLGQPSSGTLCLAELPTTPDER